MGGWVVCMSLACHFMYRGESDVPVGWYLTISLARFLLLLLFQPISNPLSPSIHIQILQTDLYTFP